MAIGDFFIAYFKNNSYRLQYQVQDNKCNLYFFGYFTMQFFTIYLKKPLH